MIFVGIFQAVADAKGARCEIEQLKHTGEQMQGKGEIKLKRV